uniref:Methyltransferase domain-containing protein n=1 Tax=Candidatus Kentrum sp. LPFa TaxID=2126335 RepID=A0A450WS07_9GAMM|nr:MAG: Methyltransferase domain-containing protein [Candidatus Kentron sp. LPFa]
MNNTLWTKEKAEAITRKGEDAFFAQAPTASLPYRRASPMAERQIYKDVCTTMQESLPFGEELNTLLEVPSLMPMAPRLMLWSLVYGLAPQRYLEIGTDAGGSAMIVLSAIRALGLADFRGACIDPAFKLDAATRETLTERFCLLESKNNPDVLIEAGRYADGLFDLILIDGDHHYDYVLSDIMLAVPYLASGGYLLLDDAANVQVRDAIGYALTVTSLNDGGWICRHSTGIEPPRAVESGPWQGQRMMESGLYLLHKPAV